jgi:maltokinase
VATGELQPGAGPPAPDRPSRVLAGEQSNTSIIVAGPDDPDPVIIKVFRVLQSGANPDVTVTSVLTGAGCANVPRLTGWVDGEWMDPLGERARGHLASVSEFLPDSSDAWRAACVAVQQGRSFATEAASIGTATAAVHTALAANLPTRPSNPRTLHELADHLESRLGWAVQEVPALVEHAEGARGMITAVRALTEAPRLQRIHGDLHLGQVLDAGARGWILLDFEGEPLRPLADRNRPDLVHRDLAGMLRSFDYAARHTVLGLAGDDPAVDAAQAWVSESSEAFLRAYARSSEHDPLRGEVLLRALELDKALYEVVYETRNRPSWVELPMSAVRRLLSRHAAV